MITQSKKIAYRAYGYNILSEINIPELTEIPLSETNGDQNDIIIEKGNLSEVWNKLAGPEDTYVATVNFLLFNVEDFCIYSIEAGKRIIYSPYEGIDESDIHSYILGTCLAAILLQRKIIPLHGSSININGKAYAFIGHSGVGKSTLAAAFIKKGYNLLSDDVIAVSVTNEGIPYVIPSFPNQKLWEDSLTEFGMKSEHYFPLLKNKKSTKYGVKVEEHFTSEILPLSGIFELKKTNDEKINLEPINGLLKLRTLFKHTFRNWFIEPMGLAEWHFKQSTNIINRIPLYQFQRPSSSFTTDQLVEAILSTINQ